MFALTENSSIFDEKYVKKGSFITLNQFIHALTGFSLKRIYLLTDHSFAHFERKVGIFKFPHVDQKVTEEKLFILPQPIFKLKNL